MVVADRGFLVSNGHAHTYWMAAMSRMLVSRGCCMSRMLAS